MLKDFNPSTSSGRAEANKQFGNICEEYTCDYLIKNGFKILAKNYTQKLGEIDIIASKNNLISFVEVKARKNNYFNLSEVITKSKQRKIILTAKYFLLTNRIQDKICRFDVALLHQNENDFNLQYFENAFNEAY